MSHLRSVFALSLVGAVALLAASAAQAGVLTGAIWSQVTQGFPMTRTGSQLDIEGSATATAISASLYYADFSTKFFIPKTLNTKTGAGILDLAVSITQSGPQQVTASWTGTMGMGGATMGVPGTLVVKTAIHNSKGVGQSTFMAGPNTLVKVPLSVGAPGQFTGSLLVLGYTHFITVDFYGWTPGALAFTGLTSKGVALPDVVAMGSWNLNSRQTGTVTLVSPSKVSIDCVLTQRRTVSVTSLKLFFVPEPGTLLLLGAGALGLAVMRRV